MTRVRVSLKEAIYDIALEMYTEALIKDSQITIDILEAMLTVRQYEYMIPTVKDAAEKAFNIYKAEVKYDENNTNNG